MCVSGGEKCEFPKKFCVRTKWMIPIYEDSIELTESKVYSGSCQTCMMEFFAKISIGGAWYQNTGDRFLKTGNTPENKFTLKA